MVRFFKCVFLKCTVKKVSLMPSISQSLFLLESSRNSPCFYKCIGGRETILISTRESFKKRGEEASN